MPEPRKTSDHAAIGEERSERLKRLAASANFSHRWAHASAGAAVTHLIAAGNALAKARDLCQDGEWSRWVRRNFHGSLRTAQRYIRIARRGIETRGDATTVSRPARPEAARILRAALLGDERSARPAQEPKPQNVPGTSTALHTGPFVASGTPSLTPRVAVLAVTGLEKLAASLRSALQPGDAASGYVIDRVLALATDLRLDVSPLAAEAARGQTIYFAEASGADRVKIGVAHDPMSRIASLQTACPHRLVLLGTTTGGRELEAALHARLSDYHVGGEWYHLAKPVRALIDRICAGDATTDETEAKR